MSISIFLTIAGDDELSRIFHEGLIDPTALTTAERCRFMILFNVIIGRYGDIFHRYEKGTLKEHNWKGCLDHLEYLINSPAGKTWGNTQSINHTSISYKELVESLVFDSGNIYHANS